MKRIAALILSAVAMLSLLTGCIHEDIGIKLNEDGTGSIAATVGIEKYAYMHGILPPRAVYLPGFFRKSTISITSSFAP